MSASLVGSEMCIRDSHSCSGLLYELLGEARSLHAGPRSNRNWPRGSPVSYTHLTLPTICSV
eukprot:1114266-Alexandrium_andersonii.AAC.1